MKRFLIKVFYFCLLVIATGFLIGVYNKLQFNHELNRLKGAESIIFGDSHSFRGLNPIHFNSTVNFSIQAEPYVVTFWKLKKTLMHLSPDKIVLSFSPHNLSSFNDLKFSDARWSNEMFKRTALVGEFDYLASVIKWDEMERFKYFFKELFIKPQIQQLSIKKWGGFAPIDRKFRNNSEQGINRHYYYGSIVHTPSNIQINYLDSIRNLCEVKNIQLVLVSLPLHSSYWKKVPGSFWLKFDSLKAVYSEKHYVIDLSRKHNLDSSYFADSDHLNRIGAEYVSRLLSSELELLKITN